MFRFSEKYRQLPTNVSFFVLENEFIPIEVKDVKYKHSICSECGRRPFDRVGGTAVYFRREIEMTDISGTAEGLIARNSVFHALLENRITGWRQGVLTVTVSSEVISLDHDYHELIIIGSAKHYAEVVNLTIDHECQTCGYISYRPSKKGLSMPLACWDGSDIFVIPELSGLCLVTDLVKNIFEQQGFTGVKLTPVESWEDPLRKTIVPIRYYKR